MTNKNYKKLYLDLINHTKKCKYCKECYKEVLEETKKIKDNQLRDNLTNLWKTLWLNNCLDFDIITMEFEVFKKKEKI